MLVFNKLANATRLLLLCKTTLTADFSSLTQRITESQCNQTEMIVSEWYLQSHLISFADMTNLFGANKINVPNSHDFKQISIILKSHSH